jgi:hypothetical protein
MAKQQSDKAQGPIPLDLDWESPEGKAHHAQMAALPPDDPVAVAHFKNIGKKHPRAGEAKK